MPPRIHSDPSYHPKQVALYSTFTSQVHCGYKIYLFIRSSESRCPKSISSIFLLSLNLSVCFAPSLIHLTLSLIPFTLVMDSFYIDQSTEDSHRSRSRSNSHLSATATQFQDLNIGSTVRQLDQEGTLSEAATTSTPSFLDPTSHQTTSDFISAPEIGRAHV